MHINVAIFMSESFSSMAIHINFEMCLCTLEHTYRIYSHIGRVFDTLLCG